MYKDARVRLDLGCWGDVNAGVRGSVSVQDQ